VDTLIKIANLFRDETRKGQINISARDSVDKFVLSRSLRTVFFF